MNNCITCNKEFGIKPRTTGKFCKPQCYWESLKGKPWTKEMREKIPPKLKGGNNGSFKKGLIPWNKGLKGVQVSWNKGNKGFLAGEKHWAYGKKRPEITGENNPAWKGGKPQCKECNKSISYEAKSKLCTWCYNKKYMSGSQSPFWKGGRPKCKYCSKTITWGYEKCFNCFSHYENSGPNNYGWKGGISPLRNQLKETFAYEEWRKGCMERDNYTCQDCGVVGGRLEVDHIKPFALIKKENNITTVEEALNCPELWDLSNGRTLCKPCHRKTDTWGKGVYKYLNA